MRHALAVGCLSVATMLAVSCSDEGGGLKPIPVVATQTSSAPGHEAAQVVGSPESSAPSVSTTVAPPTPVVVTPDKADAILLSTDDVGRLIGATLTYEAKYSSPDVTHKDGECGSLNGPDATNLGEEWTTYRDVMQKETEKRWSHAVWQTAVLFPDAKSAASQFPQVFPPALQRCDGSTVDQAEGAQFQFEGVNIGAQGATWSMVQLDGGKPTTWRCFFDFRTKNNVIFGSRLCQSGNGRPALTAIVDRMAEWIPA